WDTVRRMMVGTSTVDEWTQLIVTINGLLERARILGRPQRDLVELEKLLATARTFRWDTSRDAALGYWIRKLQANAEPSGQLRSDAYADPAALSKSAKRHGPSPP